MTKSSLLLLTSIGLVSIAQLAMKWGMTTLAFDALAQADVQGYSRILGEGWPSFVAVLAGLGCYALSMLCWVLMLERIPLSTAYPCLSLSYVLVYIGSLLLPDIAEGFSWLKLAGIVLILVGVAIIFCGGARRAAALPSDQA